MVSPAPFSYARERVPFITGAPAPLQHFIAPSSISDEDALRVPEVPALICPAKAESCTEQLGSDGPGASSSTIGMGRSPSQLQVMRSVPGNTLNEKVKDDGVNIVAEKELAITATAEAPTATQAVQARADKGFGWRC